MTARKNSATQAGPAPDPSETPPVSSEAATSETSDRLSAKPSGPPKDPDP